LEHKLLASILKRIVERLNTKGQEAASEKIFVAAFGKHPGWDDHIDDIGLHTDVLVAVKRVLYVQGIACNIDSGNLFVWCVNDNVVIGRMWPSRDGKGRSSYPMVVCVQCCRLPPRWVFDNILPSLEKIREICIATSSPADVIKTLENAQTELRRLLQQSPPVSDSPPVGPDALAKLAQCPEMGPKNEGLLRILYHIEREISRYQQDTPKDDIHSTLLRVPVSATQPLQNTLLWLDFLFNNFIKDMPVLVLIPLGNPWIDIIIGEPAQSHLFCLQASLWTIPFTSTIPYNMSSEFIARSSRLIEKSRADKTHLSP
jgi:hypothetical protein